MSGQKHTAGPIAWTGSGSLARIQGRGADFHGYIYGTEDAAHPIGLYTKPAFADDLLEALRAAERELAAAFGPDPDNPGSLGCRSGLEALRTVRLAIAKATGEAGA